MTTKERMKLSPMLRLQIDEKLKFLAENPYAKNNNVKPLKGTPGCFRLRVGDWRVVYEIVNQKLNILVVKIGHRKEVYNIHEDTSTNYY